MAALSGAELLDVVDRGQDAGQLRRGLLLMAHAPHGDDRPLGQATIGERDRLLVRLRIDTLGPLATARTTCPGCDADLEAPLDLRAMAATPCPEEPQTVVHDGRAVVFRMPTTEDLLAATSYGDRHDARMALLAACVQSIDGEAVEAVPPDLEAAVVAAMAAADPMLDVTLTLRCGSCGAEWGDVFDIVAFFWAELQARAGRLIGEVHELAAAYGWSEPQILALGRRRRERYLGLVRS